MITKNHWVKIIAFVAALLVAWYVLTNKTNDLPKELKDRWQAVFLDDGQVYFGRLEDYNRKYASLKNVYYLKRASDLETTSNLNLIRLGGEAHGPENEMFVSKSKILFIENLRSDSTVVQAIRNSLR